MVETAYPRALRHGAIVTIAASLAAAMFAMVPATPATAAQTPASCANSSIVNGSFETPLVAANNWALFDDSLVPGWSTTATDHKIEIWHTPFQGVPVPDGAQFAELNANQPSNLYQDVATTPGQTIRWQLQHRGRTGVDTMEVRMGAPGGALALQATLSDGLTWATYSGYYTVPAGQTTTRFSFDSTATANGNPSIGNFLDAVSFTSGACVVATKSVANLSGAAAVRLGVTLRYSVVAANGGASDASLSSVIDALPVGVSLVPGTITVTDGAGTITLSDAAGDDAGDYTPGTREVRVSVGAGATAAAGGTLSVGASITVAFDVRVDSIAALPAVSNTATVAFTDALSSVASVSTSNTTTTTITPDAPALTIVTSGTVNPATHHAAAALGDSISWSYVVANTGDVPLTSVSVTDPEGGATTCAPSTLAAGQSATCTSTTPHVVTEADLVAGSVSNGATALGMPPFGAAAVASAESIATVQTAAIAPSIGVTVSHDNLTAPAVGAPIFPGDQLRARYVVTNTGNSTLNSVTVVDPTFGAVTCIVSALAPGASSTCVADAPYVVTAQDGAAGVLSRTVTATGAPGAGAAVGPVSAQQLAMLAVIVPSGSSGLANTNQSGAVRSGASSRPSGLANTGADAFSPLALAVLLIVAGCAALCASRLQPHPSPVAAPRVVPSRRR